MHQRIKAIPLLVLFIANSACFAAEMKGPITTKQPHYIAPTTQNIEEIRKNISESTMVEKYLVTGQLAEGESKLKAYLKVHTEDDQARFGLGILQVLRAIESLFQGVYEFGIPDINLSRVSADSGRTNGLPLPSNSEPKLLTYQKLRYGIQRFSDTLREAEFTLSGISDEEVSLPTHFGLIRLDLNGDGKLEKEEALWRIFNQNRRRQRVSEDTASQFLIRFDRGDVHWLRGYCHLIMGFCEFLLAHDFKKTFDCGAHIIFKNVDTQYEILKYPHLSGQEASIIDLASIVHSINWKVVHPNKMAKSLWHFRAMVKQNKLMWKYIEAETDDDREWIPNANQTGLFRSMKVTQKKVDSWKMLMDKLDEILSGKVLLGFWRKKEGYGLDVPSIFLKPRDFDLVLWVHGPAAAPYLKEGKTTRKVTWDELDKAFQGHIIDFSWWFN